VLWKLYEKFPPIQGEYKDVHVISALDEPPVFLDYDQEAGEDDGRYQGDEDKGRGGPPNRTDEGPWSCFQPQCPCLTPTWLLDKGVIDGMGAPWEAIHGFRLMKSPNITPWCLLSAVYFSMSMNKQKWESLPKDIQAGHDKREQS